MKNQLILFIALLAGISVPLMGMEKLMQLLLDLMNLGLRWQPTTSCLLTQILRAINGEAVQEVYAHQLGDSLMNAHPKEFIALMRARIFDQLDRRFEAKGATPELIAVHKEAAQNNSADYIKVHKHRFRSVSSPLYKAVHEATHAMPGPRMKVVEVNSGDVASTSGKYMLFDETETELLDITPVKALALAGHERRHYLNNDLVERNARTLTLEYLASGSPLSPESINLLELYHRAQEAFADLETACESLKMAQATLRISEKTVEVYGQGVAVTHPANNDRLTLAQLMVQFHQECVPQAISEPAPEPLKRNVRRRLTEEITRAQAEDRASDEEKSVAQKLLVLKKSK